MSYNFFFPANSNLIGVKIDNFAPAPVNLSLFTFFCTNLNLSEGHAKIWRLIFHFLMLYTEENGQAFILASAPFFYQHPRSIFSFLPSTAFISQSQITWTVLHLNQISFCGTRLFSSPINEVHQKYLRDYRSEKKRANSWRRKVFFAIIEGQFFLLFPLKNRFCYFFTESSIKNNQWFRTLISIQNE